MVKNKQHGTVENDAMTPSGRHSTSRSPLSLSNKLKT